MNGGERALLLYKAAWLVLSKRPMVTESGAYMSGERFTTVLSSCYLLFLQKSSCGVVVCISSRCYEQSGPVTCAETAVE